MPHEADPYTTVYRMLWDLVENHQPLARLVQVENRIRYDQERDPVKTVIAESDLPELRLYPQGSVSRFQITSNSTTITQVLQWGIATGDLRLNFLSYPVVWELLRAMSKWLSVKGNYTWNNKVFIFRVWPTDHDVGFAETNETQNIKGWTTLLTMNVEMVFTTLDLQGDN